MPKITIKGSSFNALIEVEKFFHACPDGSRRRKSEIYKSEGLSVEERCVKNRKDLKVVATGEILSGEIAKKKVIISLPNGLEIEDVITRIEISHNSVVHAIRGKEVGICFKNLRLRDIKSAPK